MRTVRDAALDVLRHRGLTTIFANPGSTEVAFLADLPDDFDFVLGLHEGAVVGMATGWATAADRPAFVNLHTTAGLGNAVSALATARANRVPLVVLVGQQDRRHLANRPFLTGDLEGLAGVYPVYTNQPPRPQDVPGALARAWHEARLGRGPALVIVPSGDWAEPAEDVELPAPDAMRTASSLEERELDELVALVGGAARPALVVGADADRPDTWTALVELAERLDCPVWQEAFAARAGFPQDHPRFAGHLPSGRSRLRDTLDGHDVVLVVGGPVFRQYLYEPGPLLPPGVRVALLTDDLEDAKHSPAELALVAELPSLCQRLTERLPPRSSPIQPLQQGGSATSAGLAAQSGIPAGVGMAAGAAADPGSATGPALRAADVMTALARRLRPDTVVVEETPSSRPQLHRLLPARESLGYLSAAMGGLGFALPAAIGVRMARPDRPVVAVVGDGSSLYGIQALWSGAHYSCGVLFVVLANGRYAIMDRLAEQHGGKPPWPAFSEVSVSALARGLGCPAESVHTQEELGDALDRVVPTLPARTNPLVLEVAVRPDPTFQQ
ncbi:benzoylformate decarboxylase [Pseudonocardia eucalypti]|uniref:Benzoylformate decarboxylase n=1 Tax=Pseudonocardia eucalypti TaxID=648755 RepID=A0ABP9PGK5_9PSEU|nr:benzoylformate decarboxylase [Pseudonocardia eucalypti]